MWAAICDTSYCLCAAPAPDIGPLSERFREAEFCNPCYDTHMSPKQSKVRTLLPPAVVRVIFLESS